MEAVIYGIKCPVLKRIVYVGATINYKLRFSAHRSGNKNMRIGLYVKSLKLMGESIGFEILEVVPFSTDIYTREQFWIQSLTSEGVELLNQKGGPKGPRNKNKET